MSWSRTHRWVLRMLAALLLVVGAAGAMASPSDARVRLAARLRARDADDDAVAARAPLLMIMGPRYARAGFTVAGHALAVVESPNASQGDGRLWRRRRRKPDCGSSLVARQFQSQDALLIPCR